ncbi:hypothetical protein DL98DRAFT_200734 [Cadophora sp. DSE1049]|nr:hypothetical protein DL98DRAFT_200734 [Cadophora sp. DSE1049]
MPPSLPFRWVNPFKPTSSDPNTSTIYTQSTPLHIDPNIDPRAIAQASIYDHVSQRSDFDSDERTTDDEEPVAEYHNIRHISTEYGTAVDCRQWMCGDQPQQEVQQSQEQSQRPALRRGSAYSSIQAVLRRFSWGSSSPSSSPSSSSPHLPPPLKLPLSPSFLSPGYGATPDEAPEEYPLAFAKAGEVEVREGETEQISPATWDMRLRKKSLRESVGDWFAALRGEEREGEREW